MAKQQYRVSRVTAKKAGPGAEGSESILPWILLALNPLFIVNGVHTIDFYIKAIWISAVLVYTFWFTGRKAREREPMSFNIMELMWIGYMVWGVLSLLWVQSPVLTFERLVYLGYPIAAYIVGKQTYFWRSSRFWDVYAGVAILVGLIGCCMWWFAGKPFIGFDWIMSAGRPSSTLSYRAYAGTYMVTTLPFLLWYMFSRHIRSTGHFVYAAASFSITFLFLVYTRARSGWMGFLACMVVMAAMAVIFQVRKQKGEEAARKFEKVFLQILVGFVALFGLGIALSIASSDMVGISKIMLGAAIAIVGLGSIAVIVAALVLGFGDIKYKPALLAVIVATAVLAPLSSNKYLINADTNPQTLKGTRKEEIGSAISTVLDVLRSGSSDRVAFWQISRKMLFEKSIRGKYEGPGGMPHWVLGVGQNQWPIWVPLYSDILHSLGAEVHNDWIQAFVEGGPVGFFFWIGFTLALIYYTWRARDKDIMIAVMGCIFAWIFSTQSDFLTARIYGAVWIGAIAAIAWGEAGIRPVFRLQVMRRTPALRYAAGAFFLWLGVAYGITMWADRQIYVTLVYHTLNVDQLVAKIFPIEPSKENPEDEALKAVADGPFYDYTWGVGKYLIFSPINDLSRAISMSMQKEPNQPPQQLTAFYNVQKKISREVLKYHPYQFSAMQMIADISFRQNNYTESIEFNKKYLEIRPNDYNMWLFLSQTQLAVGDSLNAAKSAYKAVELRPDVLMVQQFWQARFKPEYREAVLKQQSAK